LHASEREGTIQLWRIRPDGSQLERITQLDGLRGRSDWSADGAWLATYAGGPWSREILILDPSGSNLRQVTDGGNNLAPSFSPDSRWIVYTSYADRYGDENGCEIYLMEWQTGVRVRLTDNAYCDWQPRWSP
jgi:TolB protein